jgi:hypothetical protein
MVLLVFALWAVTSVVAFVEILVVREIAVGVFAHFAALGGFYGGEYWGGVAISTGVYYVMGFICTGLIIGGAEYHYRNYGTPGSWKLLGRTIAVELSILILAYFV